MRIVFIARIDGHLWVPLLVQWLYVGFLLEVFPISHTCWIVGNLLLFVLAVCLSTSLKHTVNFAIRTQNFLCTVIDNIFIDSARLSSSCTYRIVNSLSDHDAQFLTVNNITTKVNLILLRQRMRKINNETIAQFRHLLEYEMWEPVSKNKDTDHKFNFFFIFF
jgi:hypothetical protein